VSALTYPPAMQLVYSAGASLNFTATGELYRVPFYPGVLHPYDIIRFELSLLRTPVPPGAGSIVVHFRFGGTGVGGTLMNTLTLVATERITRGFDNWFVQPSGAVVSAQFAKEIDQWTDTADAPNSATGLNLQSRNDMVISCNSITASDQGTIRGLFVWLARGRAP